MQDVDAYKAKKLYELHFYCDTLAEQRKPYILETIAIREAYLAHILFKIHPIPMF